MSSDDAREVIRALVLIVKSQVSYLHGLHKNYVAMYEVLKRTEPLFENNFEIALAQPQVWQEHATLMQNIDALLRRLD
jgi:hypothetical protein